MKYCAYCYTTKGIKVPADSDQHTNNIRLSGMGNLCKACARKRRTKQNMRGQHGLNVW